MKLQLKQGNTLEEYKLKNTVPSKPYLEINQDNRTLGYLRLGTSGISKFTFNNLHLKNPTQYIYFVADDKLNIFNLNLELIKTINIRDGENTKNILSNSYDNIFFQSYNTIYKVDTEFQNYNSVSTQNRIEDFFISDDIRNVYILRYYNGKTYLQKKDLSNNVIWEVMLDSLCDKISMDSNNYIYVSQSQGNNRILYKYNTNGSHIKTQSLPNSFFLYASTKNELIIRDIVNSRLDICDTNFNTKYSINYQNDIDFSNKQTYIHHSGIISMAYRTNTTIAIICYNLENGGITSSDASYVINDSYKYDFGPALLDDDENMYNISVFGDMYKFSKSGWLICKYNNQTKNIAKYAGINCIRR